MLGVGVDINSSGGGSGS